ncbi:MAG: flagellar biosynthesis protein FliO, partial [Alphaproteobacteria bacterium]
MTRNRDRRLGVVEVLPVDARRRLVLLKKDDREHLVLLGPGQGPDLLVESGPARNPSSDEKDKPT